jgi:hypothetical protein
MYAGNEDGIAAFNESIGVLFDGLPETAIEAADYQPAPPTANKAEAIVVDSAVQYNLIFDSLEDMGLTDSGKLLPVSSIIYDKYLTPQIRHNIGAYDNFSIMDENGFLFGSYRDPSVTETFTVYEGLADFIKNVPLTQEDVNDYILSSYSVFAMPRGALASAKEALNLRACGEPDDKRLRQMREMKSLTVEDIRALAPAFETMASEGFRSTTGGAAAINANAGLYESIIDVAAMNPGAADEELTFDTLTTLLANGEEGLFQVIKDAGFYSGKGYEGITEETPVTREQFASTILAAFQIPVDETAAPDIADIDTVAAWAVPAVKTVSAYGIMTLDEDGNFNPSASATTGDYDAALAIIMAL